MIREDVWKIKPAWSCGRSKFHRLTLRSAVIADGTVLPMVALRKERQARLCFSRLPDLFGLSVRGRRSDGRGDRGLLRGGGGTVRAFVRGATDNGKQSGGGEAGEDDFFHKGNDGLVGYLTMHDGVSVPQSPWGVTLSWMLGRFSRSGPCRQVNPLFQFGDRFRPCALSAATIFHFQADV